jgi:hypothetical protein
LVVLVLILAGCAGKTDSSPATQAGILGNSLASAVPVGQMAKGIIECGKGYTSHELYDVKITVLEVLRGDKATARLAAGVAASAANLEYLIARIKFQYFARGTPGDCCHELSWDQFIAYSKDGVEYEPTAAAPPARALAATVCAGGSAEGWAIFQVVKNDKKPLAMFDAGVGGIEAIEHGGNLWFQLY